MSDPERNKRLVHEMVAAMNSRDLERLDALLADDVTRHCQATPDVVVRNREEFKAFLRQDFVTVPDRDPSATPGAVGNRPVSLAYKSVSGDVTIRRVD